MIDRISGLLAGRPLIFAGLAAALLLVMAFTSRNPVIDHSLTGYNIDHNPYSEAGERMMSLFGAGNLVTVMVRPFPGAAAELLRGLEAMETAITGAFPGTRVESLHKASRLLLFEAGREASVREMLTVAGHMPVLANLVGKDTMSLLVAAFLEDPARFDPAKFDAVTGAPFPGIRSACALSTFHIQREMGNAITRDFRVLLPVILLLISGYLVYSFRSIRAVAYALFQVAISLLTVLFYFTVTDMTVNQITSTALPLVIIISLSTTVHLLTGYAFHSPGSPQPDRIRETLRLYLVPTFLSLLTTAIAFVSFVFSDSLYIRRFGLVTAYSIMTVFLLTYLLAPLMLRGLRSKGRSPAPGSFSLSFGKQIIRRNKRVSLILVAGTLFALFLIPRMEFRTNLETFLPRGTEVYSRNREYRELFHSMAEIDLLISMDASAAGNGKAPKAQLAAFIRTFSRHMGAWPEVGSVQSAADQADFEERHSLPGIRIPIFPRDRNPYVTRDLENHRINVKLKNPADIFKVAKRIDQDFSRLGKGFHHEVYSDYLFFQSINASVTASLMKSLILSAALILLILFLLTRSIRNTAVALLANLVPLGCLVILIVLFRLEMSVAVSMALVVSLGIVVDDTIHILYRQTRLGRPLGELGFGVVTTSILLTAGFSSFLLSCSLPNRTFGILCAAAFLTAIISDLAIFSWLIREPDHKS